MSYIYQLSEPLHPVEVIDGDSIRTLWDMGNRTYAQLICRLHGVDAPERRTNAGQLVKHVVQRWIDDVGWRNLRVESIKLDKYAGRFDGIIHEIRTHSRLNRYLTLAGLCREYHGGHRHEWADDELSQIETKAARLLNQTDPLVP